MTEAELKWIKQTFGILNHINMGIFVLQEDLTVIFWNSCLEEWTKIKQETIIEQPIHHYYPHFLQPKYLNRLQPIFKGGPPTVFSSQLHQQLLPSRLSSGQFRIQYTTITAVPNEEGKGYYALVILEDITDLSQRIQDYRQMRDQALLEIRDRKEAEAKLYEKTQELEQRNYELTRLSAMNELLQACLTIEEAYSVIGKFIKLLFPQFSGQLYILDSLKHHVITVTQWGEINNSKTQFSPQDCWGLRRGRAHWVLADHPRLSCRHLEQHLGEYCCLPLIAQNESIGLLYLTSHMGQSFTSAQQVLAGTLTEQISLALANIKLRNSLQEQSIRDSLTGLYNRRYMESVLTQELYRSQRQRTPLTIVLLDIDHFKEFNALYGNEAGDIVLRELSHLLLRKVRQSDTTCRYRGEQFVLVLPTATLEDGQKKAEEIRQEVKELKIHYKNQSINHLTVSLGVTAFPEQGMTSEELLKSAEMALLLAKQKGRDCVSLNS